MALASRSLPTPSAMSSRRGYPLCVDGGLGASLPGRPLPALTGPALTGPALFKSRKGVRKKLANIKLGTVVFAPPISTPLKTLAPERLFDTGARLSAPLGDPPQWSSVCNPHQRKSVEMSKDKKAAERVPQDPLRLDLQVCFPLYAASNLLNRMYRPVLDEIGLTYPQYLVMLALWEAEPQSVGELGGKLYLDSGTLTPLLKRMESAGLVTRRRDVKDERRVLVELSCAGRALRELASKVPETLSAGLGLTPESVDLLRSTVQDLIRLLVDRGAQTAE